MLKVCKATVVFWPSPDTELGNNDDLADHFRLQWATESKVQCGPGRISATMDGLRFQGGELRTVRFPGTKESELGLLGCNPFGRSVGEQLFSSSGNKRPTPANPEKNLCVRPER